MEETKKQMVEFFDSRAKDWDRHSKPKAEAINQLLNKLPLTEGRKVLDIACGTGAITPYLYERTKQPVKAIDRSSERIKKAEEKFRDDPRYSFCCEDFLLGNEEGYDFAVIFDAYPHFLDVKAFKKALLKAVKKNGYFAILHDCSKEDLAKHHAHILNLSRLLLPVEEEAKQFEDSFRILKTEEDDRHYLILGQKI